MSPKDGGGLKISGNLKGVFWGPPLTVKTGSVETVVVI
jgi:hypothetical protein